ncbi:MAG: C-GCAxxG-C-C family protein [Lachnospiraceae bacterium]|nr:C-GCAxxG-C-C family protein [Lachnospiraceae bacterium]MDD4524287.1 C-GCAxxG-C-C family protein [Lachnospiraceae bacterium]
MTRKEMAMDYFTKGYNCSQSVVLAFADLLPVDEKTLMKLSSSFGGGMGRLREVCGSVTGMFMVAGMLYGYDGPETGHAKAEHYALIQELAGKFEAENGSIVCRELLGLNKQHDDPQPSARTGEYYKKRPCKELVGMSAEILDNYIAEHPTQA